MLILMVGPCGSGKTFFSKRLARQLGFVRLSSDELRAIYGKGENDQEVSGKVFSCLYAITEHLLTQGHDVIIDATNYHRKARRKFIKIAESLYAPVKVYVFKTSYVECLSRNNLRDRKVPEAVITHQFQYWEEPRQEEGISYIEYVENGGLR